MAENNPALAAVVLAGGYSSRMGAVKALLPFGVDEAARAKARKQGGVLPQPLVIDRVIAALQGAGAGPIIVVTGHHSEEITAHLAGSGVLLRHNPEYATGMFSSVLAGVRAVAALPGPAGFFLLPVDYPLVARGTLHKLARAFAKGNAPVAYPVFCGKKGHPPLVGAACIPAILAHNGEGGLKGALAPFEAQALRVDVDDAGVLMDMDTPEDYQRLQAVQARRYPYRHLFLQGDIWVGKSTLLANVLAPWRQRLGGFYVERRYTGARCTRFVLCSVQQQLLPKKQQTPEKARTFMERRGAQWVFKGEVFEQWCAPLLREEMDRGLPLFLLDEIGGMEMGCSGFAAVLNELLQHRRCIGVFKQERNARAQSDAMDTGEAYVKNRRALVQTLVDCGGQITTLRAANRARVEKQVAHFAAGVMKA